MTPMNGFFPDQVTVNEDRFRQIVGRKGAPCSRSTVDRMIAAGLRCSHASGQRWFTGYDFRLWIESGGEMRDEE